MKVTLNIYEYLSIIYTYCVHVRYALNRSLPNAFSGLIGAILSCELY